MAQAPYSPLPRGSKDRGRIQTTVYLRPDQVIGLHKLGKQWDEPVTALIRRAVDLLLEAAAP